MTTPPLSGIRIVDATVGLAGGIAAMTLADYGADVIRVGDETVESAADTAAVLYAHRGKRRISQSPLSFEGLRTVRDLARRADVLIVDAAPVTLERLGLDEASIRESRPGLVHAWLPPHGINGRSTNLPADDLLLAAETGVADQQPSMTDRPVAPVVPVLSYEQGLLGATAVAAALLSRMRHGAGRRVVVSGLHAVAALNCSLMVDTAGMIRPFAGAKDGGFGTPNNRAYQCGDGRWLFVASYSPAFFFAMLDAMDAMDLMVIPGIDGDFSNIRNPDRNAAVQARLEARMREKSAADWERVLQAAGVPVAQCAERSSWLESPTVAATHSLVERRHPLLGMVRMPNVAVDLSATPGSAGEFVAPEPVSGGDPGWDDSRSDDEYISRPDLVKPLEGISVLDLGSYLAAPLASAILGDFGATVVKIESPEGDGYRIVEATFAGLNRGKLNISMDLKEPGDRAVFDDLVRRSDVLIDNVRPGVAARLGTDLARLQELNDGIVRCTISGWGDGPLRDARCFDPLLQAQGGLMMAQGGDSGPVMWALPVQDVSSGTAAALGAVLALIARQASGTGQEASTSLTRVSVVMQGVECTSFSGAADRQQGSVDYPGPSPTHRLYRGLDGWIALKHPSDDSGLLVDALRGAGGEETDPERLIGVLTVDEVLDLMAASDIPAVAVLHRDRAMVDGWLEANGFYLDVDDTEIGAVRTVAGFASWPGAPMVSTSWCRAKDEDRELVLQLASRP